MASSDTNDGSTVIASGQDFSDAIRDVCAAYLRHFEPTADPALYQVKMEASGPQLNILYNKHGEQTPYISFTLLSEPVTPDEAERRGLFKPR